MQFRDFQKIKEHIVKPLTKSCDDPLSSDNTEAESPLIGQLNSWSSQEECQVKVKVKIFDKPKSLNIVL